MNERHYSASGKSVFSWSERRLGAALWVEHWWLVLTPLAPPPPQHTPPPPQHSFLSCCGCQVAPGGSSRAIKLVWLQMSDSWWIRDVNKVNRQEKYAKYVDCSSEHISSCWRWRMWCDLKDVATCFYSGFDLSGKSNSRTMKCLNF